MRTALLVIALVAGAACGKASAPISPSPSPGAPQAPGPASDPAETPRAVLSVSSVHIQVVADRGLYAYVPRFTLTETTGESGAQIQSIVVRNAQGVVVGATFTDRCVALGNRVAADGTRSVEIAAGCQVFSVVWPGGTPVTVTILFRDDAGREGSVSAAGEIPALASGLPQAIVEVSTFELPYGGAFGNGFHWYDPVLKLTETGGVSGATIWSIYYETIRDSTLVRGPRSPTGCFLNEGSDRVPAGGTWSIEQIYLYCRDVDSPVLLAGTKATVTVTFSDDDGRSGSVSATTIAQ